MAGSQKRSYTITALQRGLRLLQLFTESPQGLAAKQVASRSRLPVSTVHRFLANLEASGFLKCGADGVYHLGVTCFAIGQAALGQLDIRRVSLPYLPGIEPADARNHSSDRASWTVRSLCREAGFARTVAHSLTHRRGRSVVLHRGQQGHAELTCLTEGSGRVLPQLGLKRLTPNTVGNLQELEAELYRVRKNGYACDLEEHELHIRCAAAPIWDDAGCVNASLSITAPMVRMAAVRLRQLAPLIQSAGLQISRELGYRPPSSRPPLQKHIAPEAAFAKPL